MEPCAQCPRMRHCKTFKQHILYAVIHNVGHSKCEWTIYLSHFALLCIIAVENRKYPKRLTYSFYLFFEDKKHKMPLIGIFSNPFCKKAKEWQHCGATKWNNPMASCYRPSSFSSLLMFLPPQTKTLKWVSVLVQTSCLSVPLSLSLSLISLCLCVCLKQKPWLAKPDHPQMCMFPRSTCCQNIDHYTQIKMISWQQNQYC